MTDRNSIIGKVDWPLLLMYFALVIIGWLSIYSAGMSEGHHAIYDMSQFCGKQMMWMGISLAIGFVILLFDAKFFDAFAFWIYALVIFLLVFVLVYGKATKGATSWIDFGGGVKLQPSEFAKLGAALALASLLGRQDADLKKRKTRLVAYVIILVPAALVLLQHDAGSALVFASFIFVLYREGMPGAGAVMLFALATITVFVLTLLLTPKVMVIVIGILFVLTLTFFILYKKKKIGIMVAVFAFFMAFPFAVNYLFYKLDDHQRIRIEVILGLNDDIKGDGYNLNQSRIAIGSGGLWGKGFLQGTQTKYDFVPEQHTDFIFCTIGEEAGFKGSLVVILLYVGLLVRIIKVAERQKLAFSRVYGYSIAGIIFVHVAINIGMTIGLVPVIGIPLPFLSYGGSSMLAFTIMLAIFIKQDANRLNIL